MCPVDSIRNLYQPNTQYADDLIEPQRWCNRQWTTLTTSEDTDCGNVVKVIQLIASFIPLVLATVASYFIGIIGITLKVCESKLSDLNNGYPKLEFDHPVTLTNRQTAQLKIFIGDMRSQIPEYSDSRFEVSDIYINEQHFCMVTRRKDSALNNDYPKLEFDHPVTLTNRQTVQLKIFVENMRSEIPEYFDSRFEVSDVYINQEPFCIVTRRRDSAVADYSKDPFAL